MFGRGLGLGVCLVIITGVSSRVANSMSIVTAIMENRTFENEKWSKMLISKLKDSQCNRVFCNFEIMIRP